MTPIYPVILSGGSGTRLWPLSRSMYPKQFINFFNGRGLNGHSHSFLGATLKRLAHDNGFERPLLMVNNDHRFLVQEEVEKSGLYRAPSCWNRSREIRPRRSRWRPSTLARENPNGVMVVMPSDHLIGDDARFVEAVRRAAIVAATGRLVLFGIKPSEPHTGYGYIRQGASLEGFSGAAFKVEAFVEKPDKPTAERYVADGGYFWNSGIFVLHLRTFIDELARLEPAVLEAARNSLAKASSDLGTSSGWTRRASWRRPQSPSTMP